MQNTGLQASGRHERRPHTGCNNSREPDGRGGYGDFYCARCREGRGSARRPVNAEGGREMDEFVKLFPTLG